VPTTPTAYQPYRPQRLRSAHRHGLRMDATYELPTARPRRPVAYTIIGAIIALAVLGGLLYGGGRLLGIIEPAGSAQAVEPGQEVSVFIPSGSTTREIATILSDTGVIASQSDFIKVVKARNAEGSLQPGEYRLVTGMPDDDVIDVLMAGPDAQIASNKLTVPEGLTIEQTAARVQEATGIPAAEFIAEAYAADHFAEYPFLEGAYNNSLEGYLFPKTYTIPEEATASDVIRTMLDQFQIETANLDLTWATEHNLTFAEVVSTASMIEKETFLHDERPQVASVIYNRLRDGWNLQICATVVYILGPESRDFGAEPVNYDDLAIESPYNTYTNLGLPPGPICSPSLESLQAALAPASTNYYFYVLTSTEGSHTFCETQEEFDAANEVYAATFGLE
jgi:UPF0755 protein